MVQTNLRIALADAAAKVVARADALEHLLVRACHNQNLARRTGIGAVAVGFMRVSKSRVLRVADFQSYRLWVNAAEELGNAPYFFGDPCVLWFTPDLLRTGDACVDAGANMGHYTFCMASRVGSGGRVLAFEANPLFVDLLRRSRELNGFGDRLDVVSDALWDKAGETMSFYVSVNAANSGTSSLINHGTFLRDDSKITVRTTTLDESVRGAGLDHIRLVKIDVERAEQFVLGGATDLLRRHAIDFLIVELHAGSDAQRILERNQYRGWFADREAKRLVDIGDVPEGLFGDFLFASPNGVLELERKSMIERATDARRASRPTNDHLMIAMPNVEGAMKAVSRSFTPIETCWICGDEHRARVSTAHLDLAQFTAQDPELASYSGSEIALVRCERCGFIEPESLPTLSNYFDRIYDQRWSDDWIRGEFDSTVKDVIFNGILARLETLHARAVEKTLLDIGAHVGRFIHMATAAGWAAEGIELNPRTAAFAAKRTGLPVHRVNAHELASSKKRYGAVTLTDVLEHIPDPMSILLSANRLLEEGGWISVKVPCGPSQLVKERIRARLRGRNAKPDIASNLVHVNHFSAYSLSLALRNAGFDDIRISTGAPEYVDLSVDGSPRARISNLFRKAVFDVAESIPGGVRTPLAMNLQAFARKRG